MPRKKKKKIVKKDKTNVLTKILNKLFYRPVENKKEENLTVKGRIEIYEVKKPKKGRRSLKKDLQKGIAKLKVRKKNMVVDGGLNFDSDRRYNNGLAPLSHIAVGTDDTPTTPNMTHLLHEIYRKSANFSDTNNEMQAIAYFEPGVATGNWKEAGLFNASSGGVMYNRVTFDYVKGDSVGTYVVFTIRLDRI